MDEMKKELSSAMKRFFELKKKYPDCILLFEDNQHSVYYAYGDDIEPVRKTLNTPALKYEGFSYNSCQPYDYTWFPVADLDTNLGILVAAGFRVAVAQPLQEPVIHPELKPGKYEVCWSTTETKSNSIHIQLTKEDIKNGVTPEKILRLEYSEIPVRNLTEEEENSWFDKVKDSEAVSGTVEVKYLDGK